MDLIQMKLCFEIHYFDESAYNFDVSFPKGKSFIELDENSTENDISLLVGSLLSFNDLDLNDEFIEALAMNDELALVGGLVFQKDEVSIYPSCCADLQDWREVLEGVNKGETSWMGHDPSPWFEFQEDRITLWSDEADSKDLHSISYSKNEFENLRNELSISIECVLPIIEGWVTSNYLEAPEKLYFGLKRYLLV